MRAKGLDVLCGEWLPETELYPVAAYEALLRCCPDLAWAPPWDFLPYDPDCRGAIAEPEAALAALRKEFSDESLTQAKILQHSASTGSRLHPALCDPAGVVVALRAGTSHNPHDVVTRGGCLSRRGVPALTARQDERNDFNFCVHKTLFATASVREVALLRAFGCAATSISRLGRLSAQGLRSLQQTFDNCTPAKGRLALVGWNLLYLRREVPPALAAVASHLAGAQQHLHMSLSGVGVWYPPQSFIENFEYRLRLRDIDCIRKLMGEQELQLRELHLFAGDPGTCKVRAEGPADCVEAQQQLLAELSRDAHLRYHPESADLAKRQYEASIQRDLIEPLQRWALDHSDPVIRNVGIEFATLSRLLLQSNPSLLDLQRRAVAVPGLYDADLVREPLRDYLQLLSRYERLARVLDKARSTGSSSMTGIQ